MAEDNGEVQDNLQRAGLIDKIAGKKNKKHKKTIQEIGIPEVRRFTGKSFGLIINNNFKGVDGASELLGYDRDVENIEQTFGDLNIEFDVYKNWKANKFAMGIDKWLEMTDDLEDADCTICFILSHGEDNGLIVGKDLETVKLEEIKSYFINCKKLIGKPKLFFIQACRGDKDAEAVLVEEGGIRAAGAAMKAKDADVFQFFPTAPGKVSWVQKDGSLFIKTLCDVVQAYGSQYSLQDMVTKVNQILASKISTFRENKQDMIACEASEATHSLTYNLFFNDN